MVFVPRIRGPTWHTHFPHIFIIIAISIPIPRGCHSATAILKTTGNRIIHFPPTDRDVFLVERAANLFPPFILSSAGDPDPQDPHVFRPPGFGSISQTYGSGSGSFPFLIKMLSGLKDCLQTKILTQTKFSKKYIFKTEDNVPAGKL